jgi:hypothetical protein
LLGEKPSLRIVRPDGYVRFRGSSQQSEASLAYARQDAAGREMKPVTLQNQSGSALIDFASAAWWCRLIGPS